MNGRCRGEEPGGSEGNAQSSDGLSDEGPFPAEGCRVRSGFGRDQGGFIPEQRGLEDRAQGPRA